MNRNVNKWCIKNASFLDMCWSLVNMRQWASSESESVQQQANAQINAKRFNCSGIGNYPVHWWSGGALVESGIPFVLLLSSSFAGAEEEDTCWQQFSVCPDSQPSILWWIQRWRQTDDVVDVFISLYSYDWRRVTPAEDTKTDPKKESLTKSNPVKLDGDVIL